MSIQIHNDTELVYFVCCDDAIRHVNLTATLYCGLLFVFSWCRNIIVLLVALVRSVCNTEKVLQKMPLKSFASEPENKINPLSA